MSTRSLIAKKCKDGGYDAIYCHSDGYPSWNGRMLVNHYTSEDKINALFELGYLSSLGKDIGEKHEFNERGDYMSFCTAYHRDRGDEYQKLWYAAEKALQKAAVDHSAEYLYVWEDGKWRCWTVAWGENPAVEVSLGEFVGKPIEKATV